MHHRVFWHQGALLKPQMFQQQDRAFEHLIAQSMLRPRSVNWGLTDLIWDEAALAAGTIALRRCAGYFPIGAAFSAPDSDRLPKPVTPDAARRSGYIYLAMPIAQPGSLRAAPRKDDENAPGAAATVSTVEVWDDSTPRPTSTNLAVYSNNLSLVVSDVPPVGMHHVLLGKLRAASASGGLSLDPQCWPVVMSVKASEPMVQRLGEIAHRLYQRSLDSAGFTARSGTLEILQELLFLAIVNRAAPIFRQLARLPELHPYDLHLLVIGLASELHTFGASSRSAPEFSPYDHREQQLTFEEPLRKLTESLERVLPRRATRIAMVLESTGTWRGNFPDIRALRPGNRLLMSVYLPGSPPQGAHAVFPKVSIVAAASRLQQLMQQQAQGLRLEPLPYEPAEVQNAKPNAAWFELRLTPDDWTGLVNGLGVYMARKFNDLEMELWLLTKEGGTNHG